MEQTLSIVSQFLKFCMLVFMPMIISVGYTYPITIVHKWLWAPIIIGVCFAVLYFSGYDFYQYGIALYKGRAPSKPWSMYTIMPSLFACFIQIIGVSALYLGDRQVFQINIATFGIGSIMILMPATFICAAYEGLYYYFKSRKNTWAEYSVL